MRKLDFGQPRNNELCVRANRMRASLRTMKRRRNYAYLQMHSWKQIEREREYVCMSYYTKKEGNEAKIVVNTIQYDTVRYNTITLLSQIGERERERRIRMRIRTYQYLDIFLPRLQLIHHFLVLIFV